MLTVSESSKENLTVCEDCAETSWTQLQSVNNSYNVKTCSFLRNDQEVIAKSCSTSSCALKQHVGDNSRITLFAKDSQNIPSGQFNTLPMQAVSIKEDLQIPEPVD